jgi:hypothetical protein
MDQRDRADKIEPALAAEPIENAEASEPTDPTDRIEPAEPMDRIEPAEPIDRIDPLDPMLKMEPEDLGERDEPAERCITIFWQAADQPGIPSVVSGSHRTRRSRTERHERASLPLLIGVLTNVQSFVPVLYSCRVTIIFLVPRFRASGVLRVIASPILWCYWGDSAI